MSQALVVNPNTSASMTGEIRRAAEVVFSAPWSCRVVNAPGGPESLESWRDYALASVAVLPLLSAHRGVDGVVLACFGDPGLAALKEVAEVPVVGIAEAALSLALLLGGRFGILAGMGRAVPMMDALVRANGLEARHAGTEGLDLRVLELSANRATTLEALAAAGGRLQARGADVLVLGCAGMTGFQRELAERLGVVVIDPVDAGCRMLRALVEAGLAVSRGGLYARPPPQRMLHLDAVFAPAVRQALEEDPG